MTYPQHAVEFQLTVLLPVTDANREDVDGPIHDALAAAGLMWWPDKISEYEDNRLVISMGYNRPSQHKRPKPARR